MKNIFKSKMKFIITILVIIIVCLVLYINRPLSDNSNLNLPDFVQIPSESNSLVCTEIVGSEVMAANNPDEVGVSTKTFDLNREFKLEIEGNVLRFDGMISSGNERDNEWQVLENSEQLLTAQLYTPEEKTPRQELYTLIVNKPTGQGLLHSSKFYQYVNTNATGFVIYLTCTGNEI